jgi:hypothetical protein
MLSFLLLSSGSSQENFCSNVSVYSAIDHQFDHRSLFVVLQRCVTAFVNFLPGNTLSVLILPNKFSWFFLEG